MLGRSKKINKTNIIITSNNVGTNLVIFVCFQTNSTNGSSDSLVAPDVMLPQMFLGRPSLQTNLAQRRIVAVDINCPLRAVVQRILTEAPLVLLEINHFEVQHGGVVFLQCLNVGFFYFRHGVWGFRFLFFHAVGFVVEYLFAEQSFF